MSTPLAYRVLYLDGKFYPQELTESFWSFLKVKPSWRFTFFNNGYDAIVVRDYETEEEATTWIKERKEYIKKQGVCRVVREIPA